jgi:hypothetical protein
MKNDCDEVKMLLNTIASKLETMPYEPNSTVHYDGKSETGLLNNEYEMTGQNIGNALWGMKLMSPDSPGKSLIHIFTSDLNQPIYGGFRIL